MPYVIQPFTPQSNYEHELFKCFMIQPLWDTTNALLTHLKLPLRAASVHDLYSLIIGFQPENIRRRAALSVPLGVHGHPQRFPWAAVLLAVSRLPFRV